jgi:hypothetical protein
MVQIVTGTSRTCSCCDSFGAASIAAMIPITRLRPSSIREHNTTFALCSPRGILSQTFGEAMTIESWNLIFSAATAGMVLVGGIWLKYFVAQQLAAKDATIQHLQTEITTLKSERAPALAAEHKVMREYAEKITEEKAKSDEQVKLLTEQKKEQDKSGVTTMNFDAELAQAQGLSLAANIVVKHINKHTGTGFIPNAVIVQGVFDAIHELIRETNTRTESFNRRKALKGKPEQ